MEKWMDRGDCRVVYDLLPGERGTTVVLVHGYGLHRRMWAAQVAFLQQKGYGVLNLDVRGHGKSRPAGSFSVAQAAEDLHAILCQESLQRVVLCGLSMGACVVQEVALRYGGAAGYVLTGVIPLCIPYRRWEKRLLAASGAIMRGCYTWRGLKRAMAQSSAHTREACDEIARMFDEIGKEEFLTSWQAFTTCLHEENLRFDAPLLVLAGEHDTRGTIQAHLPDWQRYYPDCTVMRIADAGHAANLDQPQRFNEMLLSFLQRCESAEE